jgi:hypothetical protein
LPTALKSRDRGVHELHMAVCTIHDAAAGAPVDLTEKEAHWQIAVNAIRNAPDQATRDATVELFLCCLHQAGWGLFSFVDRISTKDIKLLAELRENRMHALVEMARRHRSWVRPVADWRFYPNDQYEPAKFLVRHLFARWGVPAVLESDWFRPPGFPKARLRQDWYVHLGAGHSLRTAETPYPLTRQMAERFREAPHYLNADEALVYADARVLGGDAEVATAIARSGLAHGRLSGPERAFWLSVVRYLAETPDFPLREAQQLVDYVAAMRAGPRPDFSIKGRAVRNLCRDMAMWVEELNAARRAPRARIAFERPEWWRDGESDAEFACGEAVWRMRLLSSNFELQDEGRRLNHCVASYTHQCQGGISAVCSMRLLEADGSWRRRLTVEVTAERRVIQVRGNSNRAPTADERKALSEWAGMQGLELAI